MAQTEQAQAKQIGAKRPKFTYLFLISFAFAFAVGDHLTSNSLPAMAKPAGVGNSCVPPEADR